jgi:predicted RNase H-like nuclease
MGAYVGVDWCGDHWLAVSFDESEFDQAEVFDEIGKLWHDYEETAERILIDIPIGLIEQGDEGRECDSLARQVLGPRSRAVFTPPVREATRKRRYPAAKRVNERKAGMSLSKQAFAISDCISAVDDLLRNVPEARGTFLESHPEVCFRAFAGDVLQHSKHTAGGYAERMRTLASYDPDAPPVVQQAAEATAGHDVTVDDVIDAVVLGYAAKPGQGSRYSLPPDPPLDPKGLPMQIVYRAQEPLLE